MFGRYFNHNITKGDRDNMNNKITPIMNRLAENLLKKKKGATSDSVIFFLGAGFSMKLPGETKGLGNGKEVSSYLSSKFLGGLVEENLQRASEYIEVLHSRRSLVNEVKDYFNANYEIKDSHRYLSEIIKLLNKPSELIFTTNYDTFLEDHYRSEYSDQLDCWSFGNALSSNRTMYKIHGCINTESDIILTMEDYYRVKLSKPLMNNLYKLLRENTCVFIGFSMEDQDLLDLLFSIRADNDSFGEQKHYLVIPEGLMNEHRLAYLNKIFNIDHIPLGRDDFLKEILECLKKKVMMND